LQQVDKCDGLSNPLFNEHAIAERDAERGEEHWLEMETVHIYCRPRVRNKFPFISVKRLTAVGRFEMRSLRRDRNSKNLWSTAERFTDCPELLQQSIILPSQRNLNQSLPGNRIIHLAWL
jgi:hypothetical protein